MTDWPIRQGAPFGWLEPDAHRRIETWRSPDAKLRFTLGDNAKARTPLSQLLRDVRTGGSATSFVAQAPLANQPWLVKHLPWKTVQSLVRSDDIREGNFWLQGTGNYTHLHYDGLDNLNFLVHGRKRFYLYAPEDLPNLYSVRNVSDRSHQMFGHNWSMVDASAPDLDRFPRFALAKVHTIELSGGEVLYLPAAWWHHVYTDEPSVGFNFWFVRLPQGDDAPWYASWYAPLDR